MVVQSVFLLIVIRGLCITRCSR